MSSSSSDGDGVDEAVEKMFDQEFDNIIDSLVDVQANKPKRRAYIERDREQGHNELWNDYFKEHPTYPPNMFRRRFRMNKPLFLRIVDRLNNEVPYFEQRKNAHGRYGLSALQKCTTAIRILTYGQSGDTYDEYLRLGESTALLCLENFTNGIIQLFGDEYLRRPTADDLRRLLDNGEARGFPGMICSIDCTLNDINGLDRSPVFDDILQGRAPRVNFKVNNHKYRLKAELFARRQETVRKDVECAFGVLQARFAIVKNPALLWDKEKIMKTSVILHNMIVENECDGYTQYDTSDFEAGESSRSSKAKRRKSVNVPMLDICNQIRDPQIHDRLKADLVENVWKKYGNHDE
uniref:DDE Tnp4 domain-containing protein n=1 Tax=Brassica oleracea var. oleracea TaxID=109376 RepID=A0A0D3DIJ8_BRAOL